MSLASHLHALQRGQLDPREVLAEFAEKVATLSPSQSGFSHVDVSAAYRRASSPSPGRLSGLLLPIKDLMPVGGMPTTYGSIHRRVFQDSDPFVTALERAGAIVPGKTTTSELGMTAYTEPVGLPAVENPLHPGCTPGGSSGGAAVAVARGLVQVAHASDGGGSIRVPAAACGVVGFKPPHNATGGTLTAQGFITRTVEDAAFMAELPLQPPAPLRVGVLTEPLHGDGEVASEMVDAAGHAAALLSDAGHDVFSVRPAYGPEVFLAFGDVLSGMCRKILGEASPMVEFLRGVGQGLDPLRRSNAIDLLAGLPHRVRQAWDIDVLLTPTLAFSPPPIGHFSKLPPREDFAEQTRWTPWCTLNNMTGWAGVSVPMDLPARPGVHLAGVRCSPAQLLGLAGQLSA